MIPRTLRSSPSRALFSLVLLHQVACSSDPGSGPMSSGKEITVFSFGEPQVYSAIQREVGSFGQSAGIFVNTVTETDFSRLMPILREKAAQGSREFDAVNVLTLWVADLVNLGYAQPLDPFIERDRNDPELAWDDILEGIKRKNRWGGRYYSMVLDNDNFFLSYRKDILSDPAWQSAFRAQTGKDLPNPPTTVDELIEVARFFEGKDWNPETTEEHAFMSPSRAADLAFWYVSNWAAPYTVMPTGSAPAAGILLFKPDMTPLVDSPGFIAGVESYLELLRCCARPPDLRLDGTGIRLSHAGALQRFRQGEALMMVSWGDPGPQALAKDSRVKGKLGFALSPGTRRYYNWMAGQWVETSEVHRAPYHAANGWGMYLTAPPGSDQESAWKFTKHLLSASVSTSTVTDPSGGYQPWRASHLRPEPWIQRGWDLASATNYVQTVADTTNHPNAVIDIRIPGAFDYYDVLDRHLARAMEKEVPVDEAMRDCAREMDTITDRLGRAAQIKAYRDHLALPN
jgi:multiple sugar transport system substrate-binding protein